MNYSIYSSEFGWTDYEENEMIYEFFWTKTYGEKYFTVFIVCLISVNTIVNTEFNQ